MSLVIATISKDNDIVVCSEGRTVNAKTDEVLEENTIKSYLINKLLIIGFVGHQIRITNLKFYFQMLYSNFSKWKINNVYNEAIKYENEHMDEDGEIQFLAAGYDDNDNPHLYVVSADQTRVVNSDFISNKTVSIGDMDCVLDFDKENDNEKIIESKMVEIIKERSKINPLINDNVNRKLHIFNPLHK